MEYNSFKMMLLATIVAVTGQLTRAAEPSIWNNNEHLRKHLLVDKKYDKMAFPHRGPNDTTTVYFAIFLKGIWIEEDKQILNVNSWVGMSWNDPRLSWEEEDYGNLGVLHVDDDEVWTPDIFLYNNADIKENAHYGKVNIIVNSDGRVSWVPPAVFRVECPLDFTHWPYDVHHCELILGSWSTHGWQVDVQLLYNDSSLYLGWFGKHANEWKFIDGNIQRHEMKYQCCPEPYLFLLARLTLGRVSGTFKATIVIPACVISVLTLLQFLLPVREKKRLLVGCCCAIMTFIEILYLGMSIPKLSSSTPIIVNYFGQTLIMVCISIAITCTIIKMIESQHPAASTPPPNIIKTIVMGPLSSILFLQHYTEKVGRSGGSEEDGEVLDDTKNSVNYAPDWLLVAAVFDRLAAIGFMIAFVGTLISYVGAV